MTNHPRFKSYHDAGKYAAAQMYDYARGISPEEFGAVPRYIENLAYAEAGYEVRMLKGEPESYVIIDLGGSKSCLPAVKTSWEWYLDSLDQGGPAMIFASGWDDIPKEGWSEFFYHTPITQEEFNLRMANCLTDAQCK